MLDHPTAPECIVTDCHRLSALSDTATGAFWTYTAHYCSDCYTALLNGERLDIDPTRLEIAPALASAYAHSEGDRRSSP